MEVIGIAQARPQLGEIVNRAQYKDEPTILTREGKPAAVVISVEMAKAIWGIAASTIGGGEYARLRRELREAAKDCTSDSPDALQVTNQEENPALCLVNRISVHFTWK